VKGEAMMFASFAWRTMLSEIMIPLALGYCQVSEGVVSKFDEGVLADMREPLMPVVEGCHF
jgi:hypothetical protein